jgi:DNA recombination protein RmuC
MQEWVAAVAAVAGILVGFVLRQIWARSEAEQAARRVEDLSAKAAATEAELARVRGESDKRAGFESLCAERQVTIDRLTAERDQTKIELQAKTDSERALAAQVSQLRAELASEKSNAAEKIALMEGRFREIASATVEELRKKYDESSKAEIGNLIAPLQTQLREFREKVEQAQTDSKLGVNTLQVLIGNLNSMNQQLSEEARSLSTALRGSSKAQGDWGELIARNLLEKAGLREGEHFRMQETFDGAASDEERRKVRPDVIVNLPGGRHLIIDSKVSLNAYSESVNAATDEERRAAMKRHLASVRAHVDGLAARRYHKLGALDSPDFVVMFVPIEPAFLAALHEDEGLWRHAYEREILLVGPTTLLFVIRIVDNLWQQERQVRSVQEVMDRGAELYEKFVNFVGDLESIGKNLRAAEGSYSDAMKKLSTGRGNLVRQVELLKQLGVRPAKALPKALVDGAEANEVVDGTLNELPS